MKRIKSAGLILSPFFILVAAAVLWVYLIKPQLLQFALSQIRGPRVEPDPPTHKFELADYYPAKATPPYELHEPPELLRMLQADSVEHRAAAAEGLRNLPLDEKARTPLFDLARTDPDATVRGRCWEALADSETSQAIRAEMKAVAADPSKPAVERGGAIVGLCNDTEDPAVTTLIREFYNTPDLRAKAMESMWRSFDRQFASVFPKHLADPDPEIRRQAVWGTGYMGIGSEAAKLQQMFDDEDFRHDALYAYALSVPGEFSRGRVRGILRKIETLAGGLSPSETELVQMALDQRLVMHGLEPVFSIIDDDGDSFEEEEPRPGPQLVKGSATPSPGRNDPCPCGSGKKYKKCHGA